MRSLTADLKVGLRAKSVGFGRLVKDDNLKSLVPEQEEYGRYERCGDGSLSLIGKRTGACGVLWHELVVNWDGTVTPCCDDINEIYVLGNLNRDSARRIWNGQKLRALRRSHIMNECTLPLCSECSQHLSSGGIDQRYLL
jgi:radical SAM protein with 4Fe4S-binding SPASM domain